MAVTDFLFQGSPPAQTTSYSSSSSGLPEWWQSYTQGLIGRANAIAGEPYQAYTGPRVAGASTDQQSAYDLTRQGVGIFDPYLSQATGFYTQGGNASGAGAANPWLTAGAGTDVQGAAQPYLDQAAQTLPSSINAYMSPYTSGVVDRIAQLGARNMSENLLPNVNDAFTKAGQFGSTRHADITGRVLRDTNESILGQQAQALEQGYTTAGQQFAADQQRLGALGQTAGQLAQAQAQNYLNAGNYTGTLTNADASRMLSAGQGLGALGTAAQSANLRDAAALQATGQEQQQLTQRNLDTAYQNFLEQRNYPRDNVTFLNQAIRGLQPGSSTTNTTTTGAAPYMSASPLAQLAGAGSLFYGLSQLGMKKGGRVPFDPEGEGYDDESAAAAGYRPDETGHMSTRLPVGGPMTGALSGMDDVGLILKGRRHPTWHKGEAADAERGYETIKEYGRYWSARKGDGRGNYARGGRTGALKKKSDALGLRPGPIARRMARGGAFSMVA